MVYLDDGASIAQRLLFGDLLHRQNRSNGNVVTVANLHDLKLGLGHGPLLDRIEDLAQPRQPRRGRRIVRIGFPFRLADQVADRTPHRGLGDEVNVGVGIALPTLALENPARLAAAGVVAGAWRRLTERNTFAVLAVFLERTVGEALLIAELHAREIEHTVLHGAEHSLAAARADALVKSADDAKRKMQASAAVADLSAGDERRPFAEAGGRRRTAGALRHVLVDLAILVGAGAEAFHRGDDHAWICLVDVVPGQPHAIERARREILYQHIAMLHQASENFLALGVLAIDRNRALRAVQHGEIKAVLSLHIAKLGARNVAHAGALDLDHVGPHVGEKLCAGRTRLHVREIQDLHALERPARLAPRLRACTRQAIAIRRLRRRLL